LRFSAPEAYVLVISDMQGMSKMNGFDLVRRIRQIKPEIKVLLITAFEINNNEFSSVLPSIKVDGFIQKPFTPSKLVDGIREVLMQIRNQ
jgi:two-component system response regulator ChvI